MMKLFKYHFFQSFMLERSSVWNVFRNVSVINFQKEIKERKNYVQMLLKTTDKLLTIGIWLSIYFGIANKETKCQSAIWRFVALL